jgi:hypothetical protein
MTKTAKNHGLISSSLADLPSSVKKKACSAQLWRDIVESFLRRASVLAFFAAFLFSQEEAS